MDAFDLSDVEAELWTERTLRRVLSQRSRAFTQGWKAALETLEQPGAPERTVDAITELRGLVEEREPE